MTSTASLLRAGAVIAALALALVVPAGVLAHAALDVPTPADGATIEGQPSSIEATFTQDMKADGSSLELRDADGTSLATGGVDPDDPRRMVIDPVPELAPGTYEVRWTTLSAEDNELDRDTWTFTVIAAATPEPTPEPTPTPEPSASAAPSTPAPTATPAPTPSPVPSASAPPDDGAAGSGSDVILPIVIGLALVVVGGGFLLSRRGRAT